MKPTLLLATLFAACGSDPSVELAADYTLKLLPITQDGQAPFDGDVELSVLVREAGDGEVVRTPLGPSANATWTMPGQDHLAGARIALLLTDPFAEIDPIDLRNVRAWGQTSPVTLSTGERTLPLWVSAYGGVGQLGDLPANQVSFLAAATMLSSGDVMLFGGAEPGAGDGPINGAALRHVLRLSRSNADVSSERVGDLPTDGGAPPGRVAATATGVLYNGREAVLLAGGRPALVPANNATNNLTLLDPETLEVHWTGRLPVARSQHVAVRTADGRVMLAGGQDGSGLTGRLDFDWFDPTTSAVAAGGEVSGLLDIGFGVASLGEDGVLVCGGGAAISSPGTYELADGCALLRLDGSTVGRGTLAEGVPAVSSARMWHAMAPLLDGKVLVTGGITTAPSVGLPSPATAEAFVFDPAPTAQTWTRVADLNAPRAMHIALPLPDGRVLLIGGTTTGLGPGSVVLGESAGCPELYDPDTETFELLDCAAPAAGALPVVASAPGYDAWVLEGFHTDVGEGVGGAAWGLAGLGPDLR